MNSNTPPAKPLRWWQYILLGLFCLFLTLGIVALGIMNGG
jgi:hypothetical protein